MKQGYRITILTNEKEFIDEIVEVAKKYEAINTSTEISPWNQSETTPAPSGDIPFSERRFKPTLEQIQKDPVIAFLVAMESDSDGSIACPAADDCGIFGTDQCELTPLKRVK